MISRMPNGSANPAQGCLLLVRNFGCQSGKVVFNAILNAQVAFVNEHAQTFVASLVVNILVAEFIKGTAKDLPKLTCSHPSSSNTVMEPLIFWAETNLVLLRVKITLALVFIPHMSHLCATSV